MISLSPSLLSSSFSGIVTDLYTYRATIHLINALTAIALIMWSLESFARRLLGKPYQPPEE